ncbi:MAG: hypothetical protein U0263_34305 [Polyangiaceae bacterium]
MAAALFRTGIRAVGFAAALLVTACPSSKPKPAECASIRDMKVCEATPGCQKSSVWVMGFPDAADLPEHHQYECVPKSP